MKILMTGTHFTPALAVAEELKKSNVEIIYVGRKNTMEGDSAESVESKVLPGAGIKFIPIIAGRIQRSFTILTIPSILKIPIGFIQAFFIVLFNTPDVILSFGGYVSVPVVFAGWLLSIPIIVHEQTLVSGLASKISYFFADKIALSFDSGKKNEKIILTGNPIRNFLFKSGKVIDLNIFRVAKREKLPVILIMGGNQGSHIINLAVEKSLSKLLKISCVIHVSGDNNFGDFERLTTLSQSEELGKLNERYMVKKWIGDEYGEILSSINLVVCRAGINTLTELALIKRNALVIPIPYLFGNEQNVNAKYFEDLGLVKILPQSKLSADFLLENIKICLKNPFNPDYEKINTVIFPDAAKRLALETMLLI